MDPTLATKVDAADLQLKVQKMYTDVALSPHAEYHFETGYDLARKLGYGEELLRMIPTEAIESFAGVGYYFDLATLAAGEKVLDLGSGSGMDSFVAALHVGSAGHVTGVDMTDAQLNKADTLRKQYGIPNATFVKGLIEELPFDDGSFDVVISNGVINLSAFKDSVFSEVARVLRKGGRMAIADIVTMTQLPDNVVCNASLWAACIGGASQREAYQEMIERAGLSVHVMKVNHEYTFLSKSAKKASEQYGVQSVSLCAVKQ
jgi:arsenite methyltransferase